MQTTNHQKWLMALGAVLMSSTLQAQTIIKHEPPKGQLREGQTVLVDDGTCPKGQIKAVSGGSNRYYMSNTPKRGVPRSRRCIAKQ